MNVSNVAKMAIYQEANNLDWSKTASATQIVVEAANEYTYTANVAGAGLC